MACSCMAYVGLGVAAGAAYGLATGACSGTLNAFKYKIPGLLKIRYIGKYTLLSTAAGGIFIGSGCLMDCGKLSRWAAEEDAARSSNNQRF